MDSWKQIKDAAEAIKRKSDIKPLIGLILGSGLGDLADQIQNSTKITYDQIPHFPVSTVEGHTGQLVIGELEGKTVVAMQGRIHFYEGYTQQQVVFPVFVMKLLGIENLIVTNAAGGMNADFQAGDLMVITDHLNMTGSNPLIGKHISDLGPRFPDMSSAYTPKLISLAEKVAKQHDFSIQKGVYAGISGPAYMTPAELIMLRNLGGDAVGMSTVPEVIAGSFLGLDVLGISCITDMAIGEELEPLSHEQVMETANRTKPKFIQLVKGIISEV
ncbi:purine-nucleoside phosphorylase [Shimazuella sp. AN120528]|uniref:purine-nucleoside phosphorylase n=1 Tax=Shimazuella soli TaxID=1892854 RepID=UPI001F0F2E3F|nr:purine-nucleoside phosphorylase [Shimazuella soli]MCH5584258.1 purine-nucleoside phosphorylase [Shimazuella soli]